MKILYTAPNRAHHYTYAEGLKRNNSLSKFVSGFSRLSPRAKDHNLEMDLYRSDLLQTLYLISLRLSLPKKISVYLAYRAKIEQDNTCKIFLSDSDVFLCYNGSGLNTMRKAKKAGKITVVETVNCHVDYQESILKEEHINLNLPWTPFPKKEKDRRLMEYEEADFILTPSEFVRKSFIDKGFPSQKIIKNTYGYKKTDPQQDTLLKNDDCFRILYVGSLSVRKGLRYLIQAFKELPYPNKKLILVGPRLNPSGFDDITLTNDIELTGVLKGEALQKEYRKADVFCLPTIEDGFGLVIGEALSYGLPVITTVNSGGPDIITDGEDGYLVPIRDKNVLCEKFTLLATNADQLNKMKQKAVLKSKSLYDWKQSGDDLTELLNSLSIS